MNTTLQEGIALAKDLKAALAGKTVKCDVVVCTPFISVASVAKEVEGSIIGVGAEDCSAQEKGAYTGEVAANMIASTGAKYVILGHSERRQYHGENNALLIQKLQQALANGLTPIFCVGEVKEERESDHTRSGKTATSSNAERDDVTDAGSMIGGDYSLTEQIIVSEAVRFNTADLFGTWTVDGVTTYRFDTDGSGALILPEHSYPFSFFAEGNTLVLEVKMLLKI